MYRPICVLALWVAVASAVPARGAEPPATMGGEIDYTFLSAVEGGRRKDYYYPKAGQSGVTVATGVDLGQHGPDFLERLHLLDNRWLKKNKFKEDLFKGVDLSAFLGTWSTDPQTKNVILLRKTGPKAEQALELAKATGKPAPLSDDQLRALDVAKQEEVKNAMEQRYNRAVKEQLEADPNTKLIPTFDGLPSEAKTVLISMENQYGNLSTETPKFWGLASRQDWKAAVLELWDFQDDYEGRRFKEAQLLSKLASDLPSIGNYVGRPKSRANPGNEPGDVKQVQHLLQALGLYVGEVHGVCDEATIAAIEDFQRSIGMSKPDGRVDVPGVALPEQASNTISRTFRLLAAGGGPKRKKYVFALGTKAPGVTQHTSPSYVHFNCGENATIYNVVTNRTDKAVLVHLKFSFFQDRGCTIPTTDLELVPPDRPGATLMLRPGESRTIPRRVTWSAIRCKSSHREQPMRWFRCRLFLPGEPWNEKEYVEVRTTPIESEFLDDAYLRATEMWMGYLEQHCPEDAALLDNFKSVVRAYAALMQERDQLIPPNANKPVNREAMNVMLKRLPAIEEHNRRALNIYRAENAILDAAFYGDFDGIILGRNFRNMSQPTQWNSAKAKIIKGYQFNDDNCRLTMESVAEALASATTERGPKPVPLYESADSRFVSDFARFAFNYQGFQNLNANQIIDFARSNGNEWDPLVDPTRDGPNAGEKLKLDQAKLDAAQRLANEGFLVIVGRPDKSTQDTTGEVAVLVPGETEPVLKKSQRWGGPNIWKFPKIADADQTVSPKRSLAERFADAKKDELVIYVRSVHRPGPP